MENYWIDFIRRCFIHEVETEQADHIELVSVKEGENGNPIIRIINRNSNSEPVQFELDFLAFAGKAGSGKDTAREIYTNLIYGDNGGGFSDSVIVIWSSFADKLKEICGLLSNTPLDYFYEADKKNHYNEVYEMTYRKMAQLVGTECFREVFGEDVWVKTVIHHAIREIIFHTDQDLDVDNVSIHVIVADCRFSNEAIAIRDLGGQVVMIDRNHENDEAVSNHASEQLFPIVESLDIILTNQSTLENFEESIKTLYGVLNSRKLKKNIAA